jgi:hypothetical protein
LLLQRTEGGSGHPFSTFSPGYVFCHIAATVATIGDADARNFPLQPRIAGVLRRR